MDERQDTEEQCERHFQAGGNKVQVFYPDGTRMNRWFQSAKQALEWADKDCTVWQRRKFGSEYKFVFVGVCP